jgi:succinyl-CoA synthetase alpha subunit
MKAYGSNIVAGVSVGYGGELIGEIPVFDLVEEATSQSGKVEISLIFVHPYQVLDAALEAIASGIKQLIIISAGVPPLDMVKLLKKAQSSNTFILGSGSQGLVIPGQIWLGIQESQFYTAGKVGIISRSDRLSDEVALSLTQAGLGQSMAVSLGTDGIIGSNFEQWLQVLEEDENTEAIVLLGQPTGTAEIAAAEYIASTIEKPVIAYIAGLRSPLESSFGDAATIIATQLSYSTIPSTSTGEKTLSAFSAANVSIARRPSEIVALVKKTRNP